jgi:HSP90 family molecular chaperone
MSADSRDTLPMSVADMTFMVNKLGEDCSPLQYIRELTQNAIEAIRHLGGEPGDVIWDVNWPHYDLDDVFKLCCIDTGIGMTGPEMVEYINKLSSSLHQQSSGGNFGVGAKIAAASRNPHGIV